MNEIIIETSNEIMIVPVTMRNKKYTRLANKMLKYPTEDLKPLIHTEDLKQEFISSRLLTKEVVVNFIKKVYEFDIDYFESLNVSDEIIYRGIDAMGERYFAIYRLIKYCFSKIKKKLNNCPKSTDELFLSIVSFEHTRPIELLIENDYVEISQAKSSRYSREMSRYIKSFNNKEISAKQMNKLRKNIPDYLKNVCVDSPWGDVLEIINTIDDSKVRLLGHTYNASMEYLFESLARGDSYRNAQGYLLKSERWKYQSKCK